MPESPDIKTPTQQSPLNMTGGMGSTVRDVPRPQSGGTALPGMQIIILHSPCQSLPSSFHPFVQTKYLFMNKCLLDN